MTTYRTVAIATLTPERVAMVRDMLSTYEGPDPLLASLRGRVLNGTSLRLEEVLWVLNTERSTEPGLDDVCGICDEDLALRDTVYNRWGGVAAALGTPTHRSCAEQLANANRKLTSICAIAAMRLQLV